MKEIMFRVWDGDEMSSPDDDKGYFIYLDGDLNSHDRYRPLGTEILMQYTGLKDKNGVDIYEGDIIKGILLGKKEPIYKKEIIFKHGVFGFSLKEYTTISTMMKIKALEEVEIIGNIHENPEMIDEN